MITDEPTNILIVDDLPEKLLVYRTILDELGLNLIAVGSGDEALRAVLRHDFAVILLDVQMPGMNGLETASLIRRRRRSAHTPIIFLTAFADEVRVTEGYAQGAVDYITTPVVPGILRAKVRVFADLYRMTQKVKRQAEEQIALAEERTKRETAEEANRRLAFLAQAGAVLGQSLDPEVTAREVVRLPLPFLADEAILVLLQNDGTAGKFLRTHVGPSGPVLEEPANYRALDRDLATVIDKTLAGTPLAVKNESLAVTSLRVQGRTFAVLLLSRMPSGRPFLPADLTVAEAFTSRSAIALENARLYLELQQKDRQKNEFLSMLAHELRNPLAPIRNATVILGQKATDPNRVRWAYGVIDRQLTHLVRLVDDLLDVSRITLGKIRLEVEPFDLEAAVAQAVEATRPLLDQLRHQLKVTLPPYPLRVMGDKVRLTQVFTNLLNNAAKYTEPGGQIRLTANSESAMVEVRVRDSGVGISDDLLPSIFDLFTQANRSLDRSQGGLGVGLTLVRRLVEMHGGTVQAYSDGPSRGSEFVVRLPALVEHAASTPVPPTAPEESREESELLRIVVVDDNVDSADSLADLLGLLGHKVRVAYNGPTGIATVQEFDPDLVLLDIGLPGMDGYEVARQLRDEREGRPILVAVSGYGRDDDRRLSQEAGFEHHFVKPVEFVAIQTLLASIRATSCP